MLKLLLFWALSAQASPYPKLDEMFAAPPHYCGPLSSGLSQRLERLDKRLRSWIFLFDASDANPLLSPTVKRLREEKLDCLFHFLYRVMDQELGEIKDPTNRRCVSVAFMLSENARIEKWLTDEGAYRGHLEGTRSGEGPKPRATPLLTSLWLGVKSLSKDDLTKRSCPQELGAYELLPFIDRGALTDLLEARSDQRRSLLLEQMLDSTPLPELPQKDHLVAASALALRPAAGPIDPRLNQASEFLDFYWQEIPRLAYEFSERFFVKHQEITAATCKKLDRVLYFGILAGLEQDGFTHEKFRFTHSVKVEWSRLATGLMAAAMNPKLARVCGSAFLSLQRLTGGQIELSNEYRQLSEQTFYQGGNNRDVRVNFVDIYEPEKPYAFQVRIATKAQRVEKPVMVPVDDELIAPLLEEAKKKTAD